MNMMEFSNTEGYLQLKTRWSSTGLPEFICSGLIWGCSGGDWDTSNDVLSQIKHRGHLPSANYLFFLCQTIIPAKASSFVTFFVCLCDLLEKIPPVS